MINRIQKRMRYTIEQFQRDSNFSGRYAYWRLQNELGGRAGLTHLSRKAKTKREKYIIQYMQSELNDIIWKYQAKTECGDSDENSPIWTGWWDGENNAPELVKQCIRSIRAGAGKHPLHVINYSNISEYLDIPDFIYEKLRTGAMKKAHFMDYVRVCLLYRYGGVWLDATIFCTRELPESVFAYPFITCKGPIRTGKYISDYRWTTFALGGFKGNTLFSFLKDSFEIYWLENNFDIDYLMFDYMVYIGYQTIPFIKHLIDNVPDNNFQRDDLQKAMNEQQLASSFKNYLHQDTYLYKLSWRETYQTDTLKGEKTVYQAFLDYENIL